ncbi:hypothetical protein STEG23_002836, partial [Scotinomys teguina]
QDLPLELNSKEDEAPMLQSYYRLFKDLVLKRKMETSSELLWMPDLISYYYSLTLPVIASFALHSCLQNWYQLEDFIDQVELLEQGKFYLLEREQNITTTWDYLTRGMTICNWTPN